MGFLGNAKRAPDVQTIKQSLNQLLKYQLKLLNVLKTMFKLFVIVCVRLCVCL